MTLTEVKRLRSNQTVWVKGEYNADGTAMRVRVTGKVQTWKTRPSEVQVPVKHGMYESLYITHRNMSDFTLKEPAPKKRKR